MLFRSDEKRGHDYDLIATGHYAMTEIDEEGRKWLCTSPDPVKDQTDFLAQIYDWQLRKALFPIGHYMKDEVRTIAEREHLVNAKRKDQCMKVKSESEVVQLCQTPSDPMECSPPGSSIHGIFHASVLEWGALPSPM